MDSKTLNLGQCQSNARAVAAVTGACCCLFARRDPTAAKSCSSSWAQRRTELVREIHLWPVRAYLSLLDCLWAF